MRLLPLPAQHRSRAPPNAHSTAAGSGKAPPDRHQPDTDHVSFRTDRRQPLTGAPVSRPLLLGFALLTYFGCDTEKGLRGEVDAADADVVIRGSTESYLGLTLGGPADLDGDGGPDLLIGAPGDNTGGQLAGAAFVLLGGGL